MTRWLVAIALCALAGCAAPLAGTAQPVAPAPPRDGAAPPALPPPVPLASVDPPPPATAAQDPSAGDAEAAAIDDDDDEETAAPSLKPPADALALTLSDAEIDQRFHHDLASLGPASVGPAHAGALVNGVQMPKSDLWQLTDPGRAWGTQETVDDLTRCIERVNQRFPGAPPITIGHLSAKNGGHLSPHKSHQSGRDADVGYYYRAGAKPFIHATADNLDLPRTWALVKTALKETTVEMILMDQSVQRVLASYAATNGEDPAFVDQVFQVRGKNPRAPIRHIKGHDNHIHFRFHNPIAEAMGQRVARFVAIPRPREGAPRVFASQAEVAGYAPIRARNGDTLVVLARRYGTTVEEIQRANNLSGNAIRAGAVYRIPQKGVPQRSAGPKAAGHAVAAGASKHHGAPAASSHVRSPSRVAARKSAKPALRTPPRAGGHPPKAAGAAPER